MGFPDNWYYGNYFTQIRLLSFITQIVRNMSKKSWMDIIILNLNGIIEISILSKYVHNLMKEKLDRVVVRLLD
jgi:hypothetical protein